MGLSLVKDGQSSDEPPGPPVNQALIEILEVLLEEARAGEITAVAVASIGLDGHPYTEYVYDQAAQFFALHFALGVLIHDLESDEESE